MKSSPYQRRWLAVQVYSLAPGFGKNKFVFLGNDNFRPDETQPQFTRRICKRFGVTCKNVRYVANDF